MSWRLPESIDDLAETLRLVARESDARDAVVVVARDVVAGSCGVGTLAHALRDLDAATARRTA